MQCHGVDAVRDWGWVAKCTATGYGPVDDRLYYTVNTTSPGGNKSIGNIIIVGSGTTKTLARRVEGYI